MKPDPSMAGSHVTMGGSHVSGTFISLSWGLPTYIIYSLSH